jgi:hypothetical protein
MIMRFFFLLTLSITLFSCFSSKEIVSSSPSLIEEDTRPDWVKKEPISPSYYIGIGMGNKNNPNIDYRQQAKKMLLTI